MPGYVGSAGNSKVVIGKIGNGSGFPEYLRYFDAAASALAGKKRPTYETAENALVNLAIGAEGLEEMLRMEPDDLTDLKSLITCYSVICELFKIKPELEDINLPRMPSEYALRKEELRFYFSLLKSGYNNYLPLPRISSPNHKSVKHNKARLKSAA